MVEIHKCGQGWAYCNGNCPACAVNNYYTTSGTITLVKDYPKERKKQTNADKIRQMSDEELAEWLENHCYQYGWLSWLKQEAESDG